MHVRIRSARKAVLVVLANSSAWNCMLRFLKRAVAWISWRHLLRKSYYVNFKCSENGADFYGLPRNEEMVDLEKIEWTLELRDKMIYRVPDSYEFGDSVVIPLKAGESLHWKWMHWVVCNKHAKAR